MDMDYNKGLELMQQLSESDEIYGYKVGSLWLLENGIIALKNVHKETLKTADCGWKQRVILDMQKWGTDIPEIVEKQLQKVAKFTDEAIVCPMGAGSNSLEAFAKTALSNEITPICVLKMTHPNADKYLKVDAEVTIFSDALQSGIRNFVIPATKPLNITVPKALSKEINFYATGFKAQGGQTKPMVDFGVTRFILGRAIYEAPDPLKVVHEIFNEINGAS